MSTAQDAPQLNIPARVTTNASTPGPCVVTPPQLCPPKVQAGVGAGGAAVLALIDYRFLQDQPVCSTAFSAIRQQRQQQQEPR